VTASEVFDQGRNESQSGEQAAKTTIFISYSRKNMAFADRLEAGLKAKGFEPLIDRDEIYAFEDWWKRIQSLIAQADTIVFVLSPDSVASNVCAKEVAYGASLNKRFAPIVYPPIEASKAAICNGRFTSTRAVRSAQIPVIARGVAAAAGARIGAVSVRPAPSNRHGSRLGAARTSFDASKAGRGRP